MPRQRGFLLFIYIPHSLYFSVVSKINITLKAPSTFHLQQVGSRYHLNEPCR